MKDQAWSLAIDIGGTFTDLALLDPHGNVITHKILSTPDDPNRAVLQGCQEILRGLSSPSVDRVIHGTTLVTNAILERRGARTALMTTQGFRDVLEIRREGRYDLYDLKLEFPEPLVPRDRRFEVRERLDDQGKVLEAISKEEVHRVLDQLKSYQVEALAICFLHAYANPQHEQLAREWCLDHESALSVSISSEVAPEIREYERTSTTVANAYVQGVTRGYLTDLSKNLNSLGLSKAPTLQIMQSDGGMMTPDAAQHLPIRLVESGPAGGVLAAARVGIGLGDKNVVAFDMGGTTAKIAFIEDGKPRVQSTFEVDRQHFYRKGSGLPLLVPSMDLVEIGAGGGSLASVGPLGTLLVGPQSSGADPGPACYARGGTKPTVTDADVVLGLLDPEYFLGGKLTLDKDKAVHAIQQAVANPLGVSVPEAAHAIYETIGSHMAEAARVHAAERGLDLQNHTLVAFGGAGPVHAWSLAKQLRLKRVLFPTHAGVASCLGFLGAAPAFEVVQTQVVDLTQLNMEKASQTLSFLTDRAKGILGSQASRHPHREVRVDMRYQGQGSEIQVRLGDVDQLTQDILRSHFESTYQKLYGRTIQGIPIEIVTWRVRLEGDPTAVPPFDAASEGVASKPLPVLKRSREAWLPGGTQPEEVCVVRRQDLEEGTAIEGPLIVEEEQSTLILGHGRGRVLKGGALLMELAS
ncbi:MAG: hydantoinase/oxoprolinase family protein [Candidatus Eisenbacteria bacterium]|uniref:Hydantoinase/oxoprolinase family protein n=1 Tax=Eiseniibacteriota bacterium TaxID=2212470 RepID=A0A7Y2H3X6_UNCEI|nr:hydantoinase/oxoprolinase family protein [Candidatus Eisenbacteria bacterium]